MHARLVISLAFFIALFSSTTRLSAQEMTTVWTHDHLRVAVPYDNARPGRGLLTLELLSPEDDVLGRSERTVQVSSGKGMWTEEVAPAHPMPFDELIWERLRYSFTFEGERSVAFTGTRTIADVLRRPVLRLLGQTTFLAGEPAAMRVLVSDGTAAVAAGTIHIELLVHGAKPRELFTGHLDRRGTVEAAFRFPTGLLGEASLRVTAETPDGSTETTEAIHLSRNVSILLTTEKPIYQPSQTIHIRALALDRATNHAAAERPVIFEIEDARDNKVFRKFMTTDAYGIASAAFTLADEVNLGAWHLHARIQPASSTPEAASEGSADLTLQVQRYVLPKFRVAVHFTAHDGKEQRDYRPGDHVSGTVDAGYFFGKPVSDAGITMRISGFDVSLFEAAKCEGHTDGSGRYAFDLTLPESFAGRPLSKGAAPLLVEATVKDTAGHAETRSEAITVSSSSMLLQAVAEGGRLVPGIDNIVYLLASYPDGSPAQAHITAHANGMPARNVDTGDTGVARIHITPRAGDLKLRLEADDHRSHRAAATVQLQARDGDDQLLLRTNLAVYKPGASITVDALTTKQSGTVYIDFIRNHQTFMTRDVDIVNAHAQLTVPATPAMAGTLEINAYMFGQDSRAIVDRRLVFVQPAEELRIEARADAASYLPGSDARVHFRVTDTHGHPVQAALGIEVVDEAVFALAEKQPGFAKVFFYLERELLKPRFEIHSLSANEVIAPAQESHGEEEQREDAARVFLSEVESVDPNKLDAEAGRELPEEKRADFEQRYRDAFFEQAEKLASSLHERFPHISEVALRKDFASLPGAMDAWGTALRIEDSGRTGDARIARIVSAGRDRQFDTADDLSVAIDLRNGAIFQPPSHGHQSLRIDHDRGAANGFATLTGVVTDTSGAAIPNARIEVRGREGSLRRTLSTAIGVYSLAGLPLGRYRVRLAAPGFEQFETTLNLEPRDLATLNVELNVGAVMETIMVANAAAVVDLPGNQRAFMDRMAAAPAAGHAAGINGLFAGLFAEAKSTTDRGSDNARTEARARSFFPEALFIMPELITDPNGSADLSIPIADSITTWRMAMFASTKSGALGSAGSSLKVFQDFFIDLDLPVTITQGDSITVPVAVYNYAGRRADVSLSLENADWFSLPDGTASKTVATSSGEVTSAGFTIRAEHVGRFKLTVAARMNGSAERQDAITREIEVIPNGQEREAVFNGRLDGDARVTRHVSFPANALPEASGIFVRLYPGPLSQVVEGMDGILRMPYGCFEQTSSSTYPNVLALDYMKRTHKLTPEVHAKAEGFIATGYQRLLTFEVRSGGFSWFGEAPANKILTAYGLMEFHDMAAVHDVDPRVIERTQDWLIAQQQADGSWKPDTNFINEGATDRFNTDTLRITAYIAWSLEATGYRGPALEKARRLLDSRLDDRSAEPDAYTLAVLANFAVDGPGDVGFTRAILTRLLNAATEHGDELYWSSRETAMFGSGTSADVETTGLAAQALLKSNSNAESARKALAWLLSKKSGNGNWGSTQATIMALRALVMASERSGADTVGSIEVLLNGTPVRTVTINKENNDLLQQFSLPASSAGSADEVELRFHGTGNPAYQIAGRYFIPWSDRVAHDALSIDVSYDRTKLAASDVATATATVRNNLDKTANMVMVDLGIPPGFDLMTEDLQDEVERTMHARTGKLEKFSLTATQAILYFNSIGANQTLKLHFRLRAKYPIHARTFESRVYEYYDPSVSASARPTQFEVTK